MTKKVQFDAAVSTNAKEVEKKHPEPSPTRIILGKAHPLRDLIAFLSVFALAVLLASDISFGKSKKKVKAKPTNVKKKNIMEKTIQTIIETRYREKTCDIFLHNGKIPRSGLSFFAGKGYDIGEILLDDIIDSTVAVLIKPHPTLANAKFVLHDDGPRYSLETTQPVAMGDEFFLSFNDTMVLSHPEFYTGIPTISDYQAAYEIADGLPYANPPSNKWKRTHQRQPGFGTIHKHVRDAVAKVNPVVAHLLLLAPGDPERSVPEMFLRRQSVTRAGTCVEAMHMNAYKTGELVAQIPLELSKNCSSVAYRDYCGIVSSIGFGENANVKLEWKTDSDNHRPVLQAIATRSIPAKTAFVAEPMEGKTSQKAQVHQEL